MASHDMYAYTCNIRYDDLLLINVNECVEPERERESETIKDEFLLFANASDNILLRILFCMRNDCNYTVNIGKWQYALIIIGKL